MKFFSADFEPGILFLLLWGLFSWFSKKKRKKPQQQDSEPLPTAEKKEDIFTRLRKLQDHLAHDVELAPGKMWEEGIPPEDEDYFEPVEIIPEPIEEEDSTSWIDKHHIQHEAQPVPLKQKNWVDTVFSQREGIKRAIVLNEILGQPRALKPFEEGLFDA